MAKDKDISKSWIKFFITLILVLMLHKISTCLDTIAKTPAPPAQILNSIKVNNIRVSEDIIDKFFGVVNIKGTAENISPYLKSNIVITVELQDRNGVKIGTKEIEITSLAPSQQYKINEPLWNKEVKSYKVKSITTK